MKRVTLLAMASMGTPSWCQFPSLIQSRRPESTGVPRQRRSTICSPSPDATNRGCELRPALLHPSIPDQKTTVGNCKPRPDYGSAIVIAVDSFLRPCGTSHVRIPDDENENGHTYYQVRRHFLHPTRLPNERETLPSVATSTASPANPPPTMSGRRPAIKGEFGSATVTGAVMSPAFERGVYPLALMFVR